MESDLLRIELERQFELEELHEIGRDALGLEPDDVVATATKATFAKALVERSAKASALEALADAMVAAREELADRFASRNTEGFASRADIEEGEAFGPYRIDAKIGVGRLGVVYRARDQAGEVRLKVFHPEAVADLRARHRFETHQRLAARVFHAGLPAWLTVGEVDGRCYTAQQFVEGETLDEALGRSGPMSLADVRPLLLTILEALSELHTHRLVHGALHLGNVILSARMSGFGEGGTIALLDPGSSLLRLSSPQGRDQSSRLAALAPTQGFAPEQLRGGTVGPRADVYAFGALLYQVISGSPVFGGTPEEIVIGHLSREPTPLVRMAPVGWVSEGLNQLVLAMLAKDPAQRPPDAFDVHQALEGVPVRAPRASNMIPEEELEERVDSFLQDPSEEASAMLEALIDDGASPARIADAFTTAADGVAYSGAPGAHVPWRRLVMRAIRLYEITLRDLPAAEGLVQSVLESDPKDPDALAILARLQRAQGKHEDLIESLLERSQEAETGAERADLLAEIGRIYSKDLNDKPQALVAYSSAFCEDPTRTTLARETERLAGASEEAWAEVLSSCAGALEGELEPRNRHALLTQLGRWYVAKVARPDLAVPVFQAVLAEDPRRTEAYEALADIYRKTQQWMELGTVLTSHADVATNPAQGRDLLAEAGDILLDHLNQPEHARALYERVLAEDPSHDRAATSLARVYELSGDARHYAETLEQRAGALAGAERHAALCRAAQAYEEQVDDLEAASQRYETVLQEAPEHIDALRGLDRCCVRLHRHRRLLEVLSKRLELASTARDQITLLERIADLHESEFIDHLQAIEARETILETDPTNDNALTGLAGNLRALKRWSDLAVVYERHMDVLGDRQRRVALGIQMGELFDNYLDLPERAIESYEAVLKIEPDNQTALDALITLWAKEGDLDRALNAVDALVAQAESPAERAVEQLRAAKLLETAGDEDSALERYKAAADADPNNVGLLSSLREAYVRRGSHQVAIDLMERELDMAQGSTAKGRLCGEMARLYLESHQELRADTLAKRALEYDPGNLAALVVLGDLAFGEDNFVAASKYFERALAGSATFELEEAIRIHLLCMDALEQSDQVPRALEVADRAMGLVEDNLDVVRRVADLTFEHGEPRRAFDMYCDIVSRFEEDLDDYDRAIISYRTGESARRIGEAEEADRWLRAAVELDPDSPLPWRGLVELRMDAGHIEAAYEIMDQLLELETGDDRAELLIRMGDIAANTFRDTNRAARHYLLALSERRDDRKILMKLMQLYSEEKDWRKLTKVILKIADLVDDPQQKAKYLHTAAMIASREMNDPVHAIELLEQALSYDPTFEDARTEALKQAKRTNNLEVSKALLRDRIKYAIEGGNNDAALIAMDELSEIYLKHFQRRDQAIAIAKSALEIVPNDLARQAHLAQLYAGEPGTYFEQAVGAYEALLTHAPHSAETYRAMRQLFTDAKWGDATWCCCQTLYALGQATPEEAGFYRRLRSTEPTVAACRVDEDMWAAQLTHPDVVPLLTILFTVIQPSVATVCARPVEELGYTQEHLVDAERETDLVAQSLHYAAEVLEVEQPPIYRNSNDPGLVSFLHATTPSLVLGRAAQAQRELDQRLAFTTARLITYFRPGFYVRHLIPTGTELKAWLFATLALVSGKIKIPPDLDSMAREPRRALERNLSEESRRYLAKEVVPRLIESGALDLKRWVTGVDLTADRVGLVMGNDLPTAAAAIQSSRDGSSLAVNDRLDHLFRYSVSTQYLSLRREIGSAVDL